MSGAPTWLPRARGLRDQGKSITAIAAALGVPRSTVHDNLIGHDHVRAAQRARAPRCPRCGGPFSNSGAGRTYERCGACRQQDYDARMRELERLWNSGMTIQGLAEHFGISGGSVGRLMHTARANGYNLPHRYRMNNGRRLPDRAVAA